MTRKQFADAYKDYFVEEVSHGHYVNYYDEFVDVVFDKYDVDCNGSLDYIEWMDGLEFYGVGSHDWKTKLNPFLRVNPRLLEFCD